VPRLGFENQPYRTSPPLNAINSSLNRKLDASINRLYLPDRVGLIGFRAGFCLTELLLGRLPGPMAPFRALCLRNAAQEEQAFDVVDEVRQSDFHSCPRNPDGADEQVHPVLLLGEYMLDPGSDFRFDVWRAGSPPA